ncbi:MAG: hypothetical protein U1E51_07675 [Candidatus Binatia bacterium]|nr:hypothetical protein [Candidatus Binatia bacterium]
MILELLLPRINKRLCAAGIEDVQEELTCVRIRKNGKVARIGLPELTRRFMIDDYTGIDTMVDVVIAQLKPIGIRRRSFRTKQRNILARRTH